MRNDAMMLVQLLTMLEKARDLSQLNGNHGKKIRLFLEALLRDGVTVVVQRTFPLVFAGHVNLTKVACREAAERSDEPAFGLSLSVDCVNRDDFTFRIRVAVDQVPESMRDRQILLAEISTRLDVIHSTLTYSAPTDRRDVLFSFEDDLPDEEIDAECERQSKAFDRLLEHDFAALDNLDVSAKVIELAGDLDSEVCAALLNHVRSAEAPSAQLI